MFVDSLPFNVKTQLKFHALPINFDCPDRTLEPFLLEQFMVRLR